MTQADGVGVTGGRQLLRRELADGSQQVEARVGSARCHQQALIDQQVDGLERVDRIGVIGGDRLRRRQVEGSGEDAQAREDGALAIVELVDAPRDGVAQRSLTVRRIPGAAREQRQPAGRGAPAGPPARGPGSERRRSSIARGRPSRRAQISRIAAAAAGVTSRSWRSARARSRNSRTAGAFVMSAVAASAAGNGSGPSGTTRSPATCNGLRPVARIRTRAALAGSTGRPAPAGPASDRRCRGRAASRDCGGARRSHRRPTARSGRGPRGPAPARRTRRPPCRASQGRGRRRRRGSRRPCPARRRAPAATCRCRPGR